MKKIGLVLVIFTLIPLVISCTAPQEGVKGTGKGTAQIVEGGARGAMGLGKGAGEAVGGTVQMTGEALVGKSDQAQESSKQAVEGGGQGIKDVIVEPVKGLEKGLQTIDAGIKKSTGREEVK